MKKLIIPLALVATAVSTPAAARQELDTHSTTVSYGDLDLASAKGQAALEGRIRSAINDVCNDVAQRSVDARRQDQACRQQARAQIAPTLTRLASAAGRSDGAAGAALASPAGTVAP